MALSQPPSSSSKFTFLTGEEELLEQQEMRTAKDSELEQRVRFERRGRQRRARTASKNIVAAGPRQQQQQPRFHSYFIILSSAAPPRLPTSRPFEDAQRGKKKQYTQESEAVDSSNSNKNGDGNIIAGAGGAQRHRREPPSSRPAGLPPLRRLPRPPRILLHRHSVVPSDNSERLVDCYSEHTGHRSDFLTSVFPRHDKERIDKLGSREMCLSDK